MTGQCARWTLQECGRLESCFRIEEKTAASAKGNADAAVLMIGFMPSQKHPNQAGDQDDAGGHNAGDLGGEQPLGDKAVHGTVHGLLHGIVQACPGDQGNDRNYQVADGWVLPDPGHDFGIQGGKGRLRVPVL